MKTRTIIIIFFAIFALALFFLVALPFFLTRAPAPGKTDSDESAPPEPAGQGIFRSDDGGVAWQQKSSIEGGGGSISALAITSIVPDPVRADTLYLATGNSGLWITRNRGDSWRQVRDAGGVLEPAAKIFDIAVNPSNTDEWYVAVFQKNRGRLLQTKDAGKSFREIYATPIDRFGVFGVYYDRARAAVDIVTGQGGFLESTNQGMTWRVVRWFADGLIQIIVNPANPNVRFVVTPRGRIFRTLDRGKSWRDITPALNEFSGALQNQRWFMDAGGTLWLGSNHGLLRSRDNGTTFEEPPLIIPPDALPVVAVSVPPGDLSRVTAAANAGLYSSADNGRTWSILRPPSEKRITGLAADRENAKTIYVVVSP